VALVTSDVIRPLWSVMIPAYHCARYLRHTLESVLAQDPGPDAMQIEVVDDHSTADDPESVVAEVGHGRVAFHRQAANVGHVRNFNTCLARARGHLVHILHGDDAIRPGFYERMGAAFNQSPDAGAAFCRVIVMDEGGHWRDLKPLLQRDPGVLADALRRIVLEHPIQTPSIVVPRAVYEALGGFDSRFRTTGEDIEMWYRIAARYPVWYEPEPLALYRTHKSSLTGNALRTALNIREARLAVDSVRAYLPSSEVGPVLRASRRSLAFWALGISRDALKAREYGTAARQVREALRCSMAPSVLLGAARLGIRGLRQQVRIPGSRRPSSPVP